MKNFQINGHAYETLPHPASELGQLALKIAALAGGPLLSMAANGGLDGNINSADLQKALLEIAVNITQAEIRKILSQTTRDGKDLSHDLNYDEAFSGNYSEWFKALYQVLKANGFFDFLGSMQLPQLEK